MGDRATIEVGPDVTIKAYADPAQATAEATWYRLIPWAAPRLIEQVGATLVIETCEPAPALADWRPVEDLRDLLRRIHREGIHHRDVHLKNVVRAPDGTVRLIDWETAIFWPSERSYDLEGPEASGVPVPEIHARLRPAWWGYDDAESIKNRWGTA